MDLVEQRQARLIEKFSANAAEASSLKQLADLVCDATSNNSLLNFSEILSLPSIFGLAGTEYDSSLDVLRLFAFGTWRDYKCNVDSYPTLMPKQVQKLKQLQLITLMHSSKEISYDQLKKELEFSGSKDLKEFLHLCKTSGNMRFKTMDDRKKIVVESNALDLLPKVRGKVFSGKSFDVFLQEAAVVHMDQTGLLSNGIVKQVRVPLDNQNKFCLKTEFQVKASRLFGMLIQHVTNAHSCHRSFGGKIYPGMFFVIGDQLFLRQEAASTKILTDDNSELDYGAVKIIFVNNTALKVTLDDTEEEIMYPLYSDNLFQHLGCDDSVLADEHIKSPMLKALNENYTTFLRCHAALQSTSARSAALVYVRRHHKYSGSNYKAKFRKALQKWIVVEVDCRIYQWHFLFQGVFKYAKANQISYEAGPVGCLLFIRDWETHAPEYLTESQKLMFTAAARNFLVQYFFNDFYAQAMYLILCFYYHPAFDFKRWLQSLLQVSKMDTVSTMIGAKPARPPWPASAQHHLEAPGRSILT